MKPKSDADVYAEKTIATYETQYRDNPMAKPQEITLTITNKHLFGKAFVCEQIATLEEDIFYSRFTANISDITKISINTYIKELPIYISFERPNKKNKNAKDRKRIILPGFDHPENIVAQITETKEKLLTFNKTYGTKDSDSQTQAENDRKSQEAFDSMSVPTEKSEQVKKSDTLLKGSEKIKSSDEVTYDNGKVKTSDETANGNTKIVPEVSITSGSEIVDAIMGSSDADIFEDLEVSVSDTFDAHAFDEPKIATNENESETTATQSEVILTKIPDKNDSTTVETVNNSVESVERLESLESITPKSTTEHKPPVAPAPPSGLLSADIPEEDDNDKLEEPTVENTYIQDYTYLAQKDAKESDVVDVKPAAETVETPVTPEITEAISEPKTPIADEVEVEVEFAPITDETEEKSEKKLPDAKVDKKSDKKSDMKPEKKQQTQSEPKDDKNSKGDELPEKMTLDEFEQAMRKLKIMYETGVMTEEEYADEKKRIIKTLY